MLDLGLLATDDAVALVLASRGGLTYRDIAATTGEEPSVVLERLRRGLRQARELHAVPIGTQPTNSRATHSQRSTDRLSDSRSMRSSLPWNRAKNSAGVTLALNSPNP